MVRKPAAGLGKITPLVRVNLGQYVEIVTQPRNMHLPRLPTRGKIGWSKLLPAQTFKCPRPLSLQ